MPQNKKTTHSLLFVLSFEQESTLLYFIDGSIEIYTLSISKFLKQQHAIYLSKVYKRPMLLFGIVFIPSCSPRNKRCVWINIEFFKLDTMLYHSIYITKYPCLLILEKVYLVYLQVMRQIHQRDVR